MALCSRPISEINTTKSTVLLGSVTFGQRTRRVRSDDSWRNSSAIDEANGCRFQIVSVSAINQSFITVEVVTDHMVWHALARAHTVRGPISWQRRVKGGGDVTTSKGTFPQFRAPTSRVGGAVQSGSSQYVPAPESSTVTPEVRGHRQRLPLVPESRRGGASTWRPCRFERRAAERPPAHTRPPPDPKKKCFS